MLWRLAAVWVACLAGLVAAGPAAGAALSEATKYDIAVIIGNKHYDTTHNVDYAHADAEAAATYAREVLNIREENLFLKKDITASEFRRFFGTRSAPQGRLSYLVRDGESDVFVYYAGHGVPGPTPSGKTGAYLLPVDAAPGNPGVNGYRRKLLADNLANLPAKRVTVLLDACFSGLSHKGALQENTSGTFGTTTAEPEPQASLAILTATASGAGQRAFWLPDKGHSAFTYYALKGLYGAADTGDYGRRDGTVTLREVKAYLDDEMAYWVGRKYQANQRPGLVAPEDLNLTLSRFGGPGDYPEAPFGKALSPGDTFRDCANREIATAGEAPSGVLCGPEMTVVPSGSFRMGSPPSEEGRDDDEGPVHEVTIAEPFAVGTHEITREQFAAFVDATGYEPGDGCWVYEDGDWTKKEGRSWRDPGYDQRLDHPVTCVSWEDAREYVDWLSGETGEDYRLLTEAEWEYVARAGTRTRYWWGDGIGDGKAVCYGCGSRWDYEKTAPVGSFSANPWGLHDVHGNVYEWTQDCWHDNYDGAPTDGGAWLEADGGDCSRRVLRGGSWGHYPRDLRSANRSRGTTDGRGGSSGFRVARTL